MSRFLLDTNVLSNMIRNKLGHAARKLREVDADRVCTSIIVAGELRYGVAKGVSMRLAHQVEAALDAIIVEPFEAPADRVYGELRATLARRGRALSGNDMFIASHALALGCVLVSGDRAFERVPGLTVENWLH